MSGRTEYILFALVEATSTADTRAFLFLYFMKLASTILLIQFFTITRVLLGQPVGETTGNTARIVAAGEYAYISHSDNEFGTFTTAFYVHTTKGSTASFEDVGEIYYMETISRYMFDDDSEMEILIRQGGECRVLQESGDIIPLPEGRGSGSFLIDLIQGEKSAILALTTYGSVYSEYMVDLPGNTPEFDDLKAKLGNGSVGPPTTRIDTVYQITRDTVYVENTTSRIDTVHLRETVSQIDTVYIENTISRIDTVRELITERVYSSDTVYISETINIEGGVDTVFINRTTTQRDTIYAYTENTLYNVQVDSVYLLGADYLNDLNTVTDVDPQFEAQNELLVPYPSPATDYVTISYRSLNQVPLTLGIYDNQGQRMDKFTVKGEDNVTLDVRNYPAGVYVCVAYHWKGKTTTRKFIVR